MVGKLDACRLYGILDLGYVARDAVLATAEALVSGGVDILQLRAKEHSVDEVAAMAHQVLAVTRTRGVPLIINDFPEVAEAIGADGVHVGQDDDSVEAARAIVGPDCLVGKSTHSLDQARKASTQAVDYIGFGPLFATPTKPDYQAIGLDDIEEAHRLVQLPIFCIGGVKKENLASVMARGARRVVIVSGILNSADKGTYIADCQATLAS